MCRRVVDITHDVKSFHFEPGAECVFSFEPGSVHHAPARYRRRAVCSLLHDLFSADATASDLDHGETGDRGHGVKLVARQPHRRHPDYCSVAIGRLHDQGPAGPKYLFLSAGSGITPVMSMTRTLYDLGSDADVLFVHSARTPADIIFRQRTRSHRCGNAEHPGRPRVRGRLPLRTLDGTSRSPIDAHASRPCARPGGT